MDAENFDPQVARHTAIDGVLVYHRAAFLDTRGMVRHFMKASDAAFDQFGEVYFSTVNPMMVKAWHLHTAMTLNYVVVIGPVMVGLVDGRPDSQTYGRSERIMLYDQGPEYQLLTIPPGVWNGFRSPVGSDKHAMIANFASLEHDSDEIERVHPDDFKFPFHWGPYWMAG
jgi:dTDP-4-dehydrorhamnose 3,5-epimerase